jgi:hypothetical protein
MSSFVVSVVAGVIGGILANLVTIAVVFAVYWIIYYIQQRKGLFRFFGLDERTSDITIYLSRIEIKSGGAAAFEGHTGYVGPAITSVEYQSAVLIRDLFHGRKILIPSIIQQLLGNKFFTLKPIEPKIVVAPPMSSTTAVIDGKTHETRVMLGSDVYNSMSAYYLANFEECDFAMADLPVEAGGAKKDKKERVFRFRKTGGTVPGRSQGNEVAVLQRFRDKEHRRVIVCAGLGSGGTSGCARYLATHWRNLDREVGDRDFTRWLFFHRDLDDPDGTKDIPEPVAIGDVPEPVAIYDEKQVTPIAPRPRS